MEKINLREVMEDQLDFFVKKFIENGWKQEDLHYVNKRVGFLTNPDAKNDDCKYGFGIVFFTELLGYSEDGVNMLTPWVVGRISIDKNPDVKYPSDCPKLQKVTEYMKKEFKKLGLKPFYDEDAFYGNFSRPEPRQNTGDVTIKFYINMDYPDGYWENHTL